MLVRSSSLVIKPVPAWRARAFMREFEHLGNVGLGVWHYGLYDASDLLSVLSFGSTCFSQKRDSIAKVAATHGLRTLQLCRGGTAAEAPRNTGSLAVSMALRAIEERMGPSLVLAYADPEFGEVGTIYQASNALFLGWTDPKGQANYVIHGRRMSGWMVRKRYGSRSIDYLRQIDPGMVVERLHPKMKYALVAAQGRMRRNMVEALSPFVEPYPKRTDLDIASMVMLGNVRRPETVAT